jgi:hypothetical protein
MGSIYDSLVISTKKYILCITILIRNKGFFFNLVSFLAALRHSDI